MPVGKKLVVVAMVLAVGAFTAFFFRKDASHLAWQEALENSPFRQRVERRVAADAEWAKRTSSTRIETVTQNEPAFRIPTAETAAIRQQPIEDTQPAFQRSFNPVGALLEPIEAPLDGELDVPQDDGGDFVSHDPISPTDIRHTIADGDTLSMLAKRYLGRGDRYLEIFEYNRQTLSSPDLLPIGVVLKIPPRDVSGRRATSSAVSGARLDHDAPPDMVPVERFPVSRPSSG